MLDQPLGDFYSQMSKETRVPSMRQEIRRAMQMEDFLLRIKQCRLGCWLLFFLLFFFFFSAG